MTFTALAMGLLACFLAQPQSALAHLPELYGREYIRLEGRPPDAAPKPAADNGALPSRQERHLHEKALEEAGKSGGPFADGLTDPLLSLAHYHHSRGDLDRSIATYRRALHLIRVNDGLSSPRQIPILRILAGIYRSAGDRQSLGQVYQYYYRTRKLGEPPHTDERLEASLEYLAWERELYASRFDGPGRAHLLRAYQANDRMLRALNPQTARELDAHIRLTMSQIRNLYLILGDDPMTAKSDMNYSNQGAASPVVDRELAFIQRIALNKGKMLLQACIERDQSLAPEDLAALYLELGDWQQWNGELRRASKAYARVVELLQGADEQQLLNRWLDQPVELPDEVDIWQGISEQDLSGQAVVEARYRVTARGDATRVKVSTQDDENSWQASRIRRMLRDTHFRPRFSQGHPEAVEHVTARYRLIPAN